MRVTVKIVNAYEDGHQSESIDVVEAPVTLTSEDDPWWDEVVFPLTGDGHGLGNDLGSIHEATIIEAPRNPGLVGLSTEWGG